MPQVTVKQSLQYVANHQTPSSDVPLEMPVWELVARTLFDIANSPDQRVRGSMRRATLAQRMLANRLVGTRGVGTAPVTTQKEETLDFVDLTNAAIKP